MRRRRGHGEGSIFRRKDGQWCGSIALGYGADGKRIRRTVYGATKQEATKKLISLQSNALTGNAAATRRLSVHDYLTTWLNTTVSQKVRLSTLQRYREIFRLHIAPHIGAVSLNQLRPSMVQGMYSRLEAAGASCRTREMAHKLLCQAIKQALKWGDVARNIMEAVEKPNVPRASLMVWSKEEVQKFFSCSHGTRFHALYVLAISTGMRQGELLALQWHDIDLKAATVSVRFSLGVSEHSLARQPLKTEKARRRIDLPQMAVVAMREHLTLMLAEGHAGTWVFCDTKGGPLRRSNLLRRSFLPTIKQAKVPKIRFHDLRHTCATLLLGQNVHAKVVQERLGHANISMTLDTYSHVLPSMQRAAAEAMELALTPAEFGYKLATENQSGPDRDF